MVSMFDKDYIIYLLYDYDYGNVVYRILYIKHKLKVTCIVLVCNCVDMVLTWWI